MRGASLDSYTLVTTLKDPTSEPQGSSELENTFPSYLAHPQGEESRRRDFNKAADSSSVNSIELPSASTPREPIDFEILNAGPNFAEIDAIFSVNNYLLYSEDDLSYIPTISSGNGSFVAGAGPFS